MEDEGYYQPAVLKAAFAYWAKMPEWKVHEAAALLLGINPNFVGGEGEIFNSNVNKFAHQFHGLLKLAERNQNYSKIPDGCTPNGWCLWAKENGIPIPSQLFDAVSRWSPVVAAAVAAKRDSEKRIFELHHVASTIATLEADSKSDSASDDNTPVGARERETMLKLIIGMALAGYRFDPKANRSAVIPDIVADLEKFGVALSKDTVRKYRHEGAELLPPQ